MTKIATPEGLLWAVFERDLAPGRVEMVRHISEAFKDRDRRVIRLLIDELVGSGKLRQDLLNNFPGYPEAHINDTAGRARKLVTGKSPAPLWKVGGREIHKMDFGPAMATYLEDVGTVRDYSGSPDRHPISPAIFVVYPVQGKMAVINDFLKGNMYHLHWVTAGEVKPRGKKPFIGLSVNGLYRIEWNQETKAQFDYMQADNALCALGSWYLKRLNARTPFSGGGVVS